MKTLDAKAAAETIHQSVNVALATDHPSPDDRHTLAYVTDVCKHLGIEPTPHNCTLVTGELVKAGITPHTVREYPKVVGQRKRVDGNGDPILDEHGRPHMDDIVVNSDEEEQSFRDWKPGQTLPPSGDSALQPHNQGGIPQFNSDGDAVHDDHPEFGVRADPRLSTDIETPRRDTDQSGPASWNKEDVQRADRQNSTDADRAKYEADVRAKKQAEDTARNLNPQSK